MAKFRGFWKWLPVESTYLIVGKYINLDCYRSNCEAEEKISLDMPPYIRLSLLHISSDSQVMYKVTMLQNAIGIASSGSKWILF